MKIKLFYVSLQSGLSWYFNYAGKEYIFTIR